WLTWASGVRCSKLGGYVWLQINAFMGRSITHSLFILALTLTLAACATSPLGHHQLRLFSPDDLAQMGTQSYQKIKQETPASTDTAVNNYVDCVAHALTQQVGGKWVVTVFKSKQVNAFALPG